jgi:type I restriction enzyme, R subunit
LERIAEIFLHEIQRGGVQIDAHRTFCEYLTDYQDKVKNQKIATLVALLGIDKAKLVVLMNTHVTEANLNEYGRFDDLKATIDKQKAKAFFEALEEQPLPAFMVNIKAASLLQRFILEDGFELEETDHSS